MVHTSSVLFALTMFTHYLCVADLPLQIPPTGSTKALSCAVNLCDNACKTYLAIWGWGNSTVISVFVYEAGGPGSLPAQSACHRKVRFYHCVIDSLPPVLTTGSKKAVHVLLCLCNNACKRSLAIFRKSSALCPVSRLLSVPI